MSLIKFANSGILMKEVIKTLMLEEFEKKKHFFVGQSQYKFNNLGLALGMLPS